MSWEDELTDVGQFRNARFFARRHRTQGGRRVQLHEYPGRAETYAEDLGPKPRQFSIPAYVIGPDYLADRDALVEALEAPGPGTLKHPWMGTLRVSVDSYTLEERTERGGMAEFTINFVPAGRNTFPQGTTDTEQQVSDRADAAIGTCEGVFVEEYGLQGLPSWSVAGIEDRLNNLADEIGAGAQQLVDLASKPKELASALTGAIHNLYGDLQSSITALESAARIGHLWDALPYTTPHRRQQANSQHQLKTLARVSAVAESCKRLSAEITHGGIASQDGAFKALEAANQAIDTLQEMTAPDGSPIADRTYVALQDLRAAVVEDVRRRGLRLPEVRTWTPGQSMPALVIAHQVYGDALREAEIVARNDIRHPGFVPGGEPLELLKDE